MNRTADGISTDSTSTCKITLSNPSAVSQTFSADVAANSINEWTSTTAVQAGVGASTTGGSCSGTVCSGSLGAGSSVTFTYSYSTFPKKSGTTYSNKRQQLRCSGKITVTDGTGQQGYVIASGQLSTFVESARMHTDAATAGTSTFGGLAVWTQIPIVINRSKPF